MFHNSVNMPCLPLHETPKINIPIEILAEKTNVAHEDEVDPQNQENQGMEVHQTS